MLFILERRMEMEETKKSSLEQQEFNPYLLLEKQMELLHQKSNEENITAEQLALLSQALAKVAECYQVLY